MTALNSTELAIKIVAMSSRDIAELCEKQHKHVIRDIRTMLIDLFGGDELDRIIPEHYRNRHSEYVRENADAIMGKLFGDGPNWGHPGRGFKWSCDTRGYVSEFWLNKDLTMTLITGYRVDLRYKVIKRLEAMEAELRLARHAAPAAEALVYGKWTLEEARERTDMLTMLVRAQKAGPRAAAHIAAQLGFPETPAHLIDAPEPKPTAQPKAPKPPYGLRLPEEAAQYLRTRRKGDPATIEERDLLWRRQGRDAEGLVKYSGTRINPDAEGWVWNKAIGKWTRDNGRFYLTPSGWDYTSKLGRR